MPALTALALSGALVVFPAPPAAPVAVDPVQVTADVETAPVTSEGDSADDPSIWVHPTDPALSLVIGNDKRGALETYNFDGSRQQRLTSGASFWGNSDVRQGVTIGGVERDVVAAANSGLQLFDVNPSTRMLRPQDEARIATGGGEGVCLYESEVTGKVSAFMVTRSGRVRQFELSDGDRDGVLEATRTREFLVGSESEGCAADDSTGALYISEEDVGLWRYGAEPASGETRTLVDEVQPQGRIASDAEGVTLVDLGGVSGYVVVSAQNVEKPQQNYYLVYSRASGNKFVGAFQVVTGEVTDGCSRTDGIAAYAGDLGPAFPQGLFVCQDNNNAAPGNSGEQNFKLVRLEKVVDLSPNGT